VSTTSAGELRLSEDGHRPPGPGRLGSRFLGVALRLLWRNRSRTLITLFSLIFAQVIMLLTFGFIRNFQQMLPDQVCRAASGHLQITHPDYPATQKPGAFLPKPFDLEEIRKAVPQVASTRPRATVLGFLQKGDEQKLVVGRGVDPALEVAPILTAGANLAPERPELTPYPILIG
jgi:ABC-type lipoprotein release transport system permease subunit